MGFMERHLRDNGIDKRNVHDVVLVGGSARILSVKEAGAQLRGELANGHCGLALKKCLLEFLSENSGGRESTASQRIEHTGGPFPLMLWGKSSCNVPASVIGRLKVTWRQRL